MEYSCGALPLSLSRLCCLLLAGLPMSGQICYQFSDAQPNQPPTYTATVSIASIPASLTGSPAPFDQGPAYEGGFTSYPGASTSSDYSPYNLITITSANTTYTYNNFSISIYNWNSANDTFKLVISGSQLGPVTPTGGLPLVNITLAPAVGANLFPNGLTSSLPPNTVWTGDSSTTYNGSFGSLSAGTFLGSTIPGAPFSVTAVMSACTAPCTCDKIAAQSQSPSDQTESKQLCQMLLGALAELGAYRAAFLKNFDFVNLFPTVYYAITQQEMSNLAGAEFSYPIEKMQQMLAFFDAYEFNRNAWDSGSSPEAHWLLYYDAASLANQNLASGSSFFNLYGLLTPNLSNISNVLTSGINAHVEYDLPRALRYSFANAFQNVTSDELYPDFLNTNQTFSEASAAINSDLNNAAFGPLISRSITAWVVSFIEAVAAYFYNDTTLVISLRQQAWTDAFSGSVLLDSDGTVMAPQPVADHGNLQAIGEILCPGDSGAPQSDSRRISKR